MEVKTWTYDEFPDFTEEIEDAVRLTTSGNEVGVSYHHDVKYAEVNGISLHLQILNPFTRNDPDKVYPCIVYVQGSAWMEQDVYGSCTLLGKLAAKGYVIAVVQYRHSGIAAFPAQVQDARNAIRYIRIHAGDYHIDQDNIFVGGSSSGGQVAMFCGIVKEGDEMDATLYPGVSAQVKGILDYYGAVSMLEEDGFPSTLNHHLPDSPEGMVMGHSNLRERTELREKATVECYITHKLDIPPVIIFHGTKDRTVNVSQSVSLYQKLKACGKNVRLYLLEGADHGGAEFWTEEVCNIVDNFIKTLSWPVPGC